MSKELAEAFHHTVYQLLFAANRARRDIQMAVSFLTFQVKAHDEDDWGKLVRVLKYLNGTKYMKLILGADEMKLNIHWYIDRLHQVHKELRTGWESNDNGERSSNQLIKRDEMQHTKFYRDRISITT
jgi:hypothetical protein